MSPCPITEGVLAFQDGVYRFEFTFGKVEVRQCGDTVFDLTDPTGANQN